MRKSFPWFFVCIAGLILAIVLSYKASTIKIVPEQTTNTPAQATTPAETNKTSENLQQQMERLGFSPDSFHRVVVREK